MVEYTDSYSLTLLMTKSFPHAPLIRVIINMLLLEFLVGFIFSSEETKLVTIRNKIT